MFSVFTFEKETENSKRSIHDVHGGESIMTGINDIESNTTCGIYSILCRLKMEIFVRDPTRLENIHIDENQLVPNKLRRGSTAVQVNYVTISSIHELIKATKSDLQKWNGHISDSIETQL